MLQLITYLRLPGVLEVDAGLSEPPGQAQSELTGAVPAFVMLVVILGISVPCRVIIPVLEWHDSRSTQDKTVLKEALPQAQGVRIVNTMVGALKGSFPTGDAAGVPPHGRQCGFRFLKALI